MTSDAGFWAPIVWFRDFYDVPRLACVRVARGFVFLESKFSDELDEYEPHYVVTYVADEQVSSPDQDAMIEVAAHTTPIGELLVSVEMFDPSRRRTLRLPSALGGQELHTATDEDAAS